MSDIHIEDFYKDAGRILLQLYRAFPRKTLLLIEDISGPDHPDEYGLHSLRHQSCFSTAIWLSEAGYLHYADTLRQEGLDQVVLSHKAFTLLSSQAPWLENNNTELKNLPPSVQAARQSNVHQLREAIKEGASADIRQVMHQLLLQAKHHV